VSGSRAHACKLDLDEELPALRARFHIPSDSGGELAYMAGNSLGLQPRDVRAFVEQELDAWAELAVDAHTEAVRPWYSYHELLREPAARLIGARPVETVAMNSLTVNLHLMMVSFYRPTPQRHRILIEECAFPSDRYAVRSQAALHGFDPDEAVVPLPADGVIPFLRGRGETVALALLGGVNYLTGELLDIPAVTAAGHAAGAAVGWDLAHAVGNVPVRLHEWGVDWGAWCSYKYINGGPGGVGGAFVHERHVTDRGLPKLAGWWSTDPATRFEMRPVVDPVDSADSWQLSNPPILAMAPVLCSLRIFDEVGMTPLRAKSVRLTGYLESLIDELCAKPGAPGKQPLEILTPRDPKRRGAQLSVRVRGIPATVASERMRRDHGVVADVRAPDVVRLAPAPMYSTHEDCWRAADALAAVTRP
jgi:kynureninase